MADGENSKRRGRPPKGIDANREVGNAPTGAEEKPRAESKGLDWSVIEAETHKAEAQEGQHGRRVCRVFASEFAPELWHGTFGSAIVEIGTPGYQLSDGSIVSIG